MITKEKAPIYCHRIGANDEVTAENHLVPILTHYPRRRKRVRRIKLVWTPLNVALLILLAAIVAHFIVKAVCVDPLQFELISMADSAFNI